MVKVNGKEVLYSTSFIIGPNEEAVLSPAELKGTSITIHAVEQAADAAQPALKIDGKPGNAKITLPFLQGGAFSGSLEMGMSGKDKVSGRVVGQGFNGAMLVHFAMYLEREANYGLRKP
ncbi:hypothetical protein [Massilia sp. GCM10023247]|uniref:hypothetical protein n=1 Tax=Massilia sp. GCM10023247 TaxID=3252643 RepID=UPI0036223AAE